MIAQFIIYRCRDCNVELAAARVDGVTSSAVDVVDQHMNKNLGHCISTLMCKREVADE